MGESPWKGLRGLSRRPLNEEKFARARKGPTVTVSRNRRHGTVGVVDRSRVNYEETPIQRAQRLYKSAGVSRSKKSNLRRTCTKLSQTQLVQILDREETPMRVIFWIAWGKWLQDRVLRLALAMWLRRRANPNAPAKSRTEWAWSESRELTAAERLFRKTPQHVRLVQMGILLEPKKIPTPEQQQVITMNWDRCWSAIWQSVSSLDRLSFTKQIEKKLAVTPKCHRTRARKMKLSEEECAYLDALDTIRQGVLRGRITLEEAKNARPKVAKEQVTE